MSARPWCCPEPRCTPLYAAQGGDQPLDVPQPGEMFVCFGKAPDDVVFVYDGVEHRNDLRQCSYTALKGLIAFQENADDWHGMQNAYGRAIRALEHHERAAQEANEVIVSALDNPHGHVEWSVGGSDTPADQPEHAKIEAAIRAELDRRFPLVNGLERGEYEALSSAAADAVVVLIAAPADQGEKPPTDQHNQPKEQ